MENDLEQGLSPAEGRDLQRIAGIMIPVDPEYGVPAAGDAIISADILTSLGRDRAEVVAALAALSTLAGGAFADLDDTQAETVARTFLASGTQAVDTLGRVVLQCYYRDDRVLLAVGHEARPPFPKGYTLEQGDWSLLDAVRDRPQLWRDDRSV
jgi:hypothetical protein